MDFDLLVIGAGSGGLASAKRAARHGAKVAIIEGDRVGGTCVIRGCVPKKLLVYGSEYREILANAASYGWSVGSSDCNSSVLLENVRQEVNRLNGIHIKALATRYKTGRRDVPSSIEVNAASRPCTRAIGW